MLWTAYQCLPLNSMPRIFFLFIINLGELFFLRFFHKMVLKIMFSLRQKIKKIIINKIKCIIICFIKIINILQFYFYKCYLYFFSRNLFNITYWSIVLGIEKRIMIFIIVLVLINYFWIMMMSYTTWQNLV